MTDSGRSSRHTSPDRNVERSEARTNQQSTSTWIRRASGSYSTVPPEVRALMTRIEHPPEPHGTDALTESERIINELKDNFENKGIKHIKLIKEVKNASYELVITSKNNSRYNGTADMRNGEISLNTAKTQEQDTFRLHDAYTVLWQYGLKRIGENPNNIALSRIKNLYVTEPSTRAITTELAEEGSQEDMMLNPKDEDFDEIMKRPLGKAITSFLQDPQSGLGEKQVRSIILQGHAHIIFDV